MTPADFNNNLSRTERFLMSIYRKRGAHGLVVWGTAFSIATSVFLTLLSMGLNEGNLLAETESVTIALLLSVIVPLCIAPIVCHCIATLLVRLDDALKLATELSVTDPLTGSANRRGFFASAANCIRSANQETSCFIGMVDLDHFKQLNDTYGHSAGDEALIATAQALSEVIGTRGLVGRLGGDEFAFYYLAEENEVATLETQLLGRFTPLSVELPKNSSVTVQASIGLVELGVNETIHKALARADAKVYHAKASRGTIRSSDRGEDLPERVA